MLPGDQYPAIFTALAQLCVIGSKIYPQGYPQGFNSGQIGEQARSESVGQIDKFDWIESVLLV